MTRTEEQLGLRGVWTTPQLTYVGSVGEVLQYGGGKLSPCNGDPGEPRKPKGQEQFVQNNGNAHPELNNPSHHPPPCG